MTKTTLSIDGQYGSVNMTITAALVSALASLTTAEAIDISSVVARVEEGSAPTRQNAEDTVVGDKTKIISPATSISAASYTIYFYYTQGKETLGTDDIDPVTICREIMQLAVPLPIVFDWSIGGAVGDEKSTTAVDTYIQSVGNQIPGTAGKMMIPVQIYTSNVTTAVIT